MRITCVRWGLVVVLLLVSLGVFADSHEQIASKTGLDADLINVLTVDVNGTQLAVIVVAITDRTFNSKIQQNRTLYDELYPYIGENAIYVNPTVKEVVSSFLFFPNKFTVEQEGSPPFVPTETDWHEITTGFLSGQFVPSPGGQGSGSEGVLVMGDRIDITRPFWVNYQGERVRFALSAGVANLPSSSAVPTAAPSHPPVMVSPPQITDLQETLTTGDFSAERVSSLLDLPQQLVGTIIVNNRGEELRLLLIRLEEAVRGSALAPELLSTLDPLIGTGAVMVWALSATGAPFVPWNFYIQQSGTNYVFLSEASFVELTTGFLRAGRVNADELLAGVIRLPDGVEANAPFSLRYGTSGFTFEKLSP